MSAHIKTLFSGRLSPIAFSIALVVSIEAEATEDCDCSCRTFQDLNEMIQEMEEQADSGEAVVPPARLQEIASCAGPCAMAWSQCETELAESPALSDRAAPTDDSPEPDTADSEPTSSGEDDGAFALGTPRDDIERFVGVYGSDDQPNRDFFVAKASSGGGGREIPSGYLMVGAMWGDVAPWYMESTGELRFEQQWTNPGMDALVVEFETDADGSIAAMRFVDGFLEERGRVERKGDLPEGW